VAKRQVDVFTAGCVVCEPTVKLVQELACSNCAVTVYDLSKEGAEKVQEYGIKTVPAVVVDGRLAACCDTRGPDREQLVAAGLGKPID
jgi:hypothetical protein